MKKMKTLFKRVFENHKLISCLNEVAEGCEWVIAGEGYATEKIDGSCCMIKNNILYKRYDYKVGRNLPEGAIPCQEKADEVTGHFPHWLKVDETKPEDKWFSRAFKMKTNWEDGTYELIGKKIQTNPYKLDDVVLEKHGIRVLNDVPRTYEGIREYLEKHYIEGIVFYRENGEMCKIKRSDFGFRWE